MSKGMGFAVAGLAAAAVVAGVFLLSGERAEQAGGEAATVSSSHAAPDQAPAFAAPDAGRTPEAAPLAAAPAELPAGSASSALATPGKAGKPKGTPVTLTGRVIDEAARPVAGARVSFANDPIAFGVGRSFGRGRREDTASLPSVETDREGRFSLPGEMPQPSDEEGLPFGPGQPQLIVQQDACATLIQPLPGLAAPNHDVGDLQLGAGTWIVGRAVDEAGRPLAGARVSAHNVDAGRGGTPLALPFLSGLNESLDAVTTGADGRFRVAGLSPGKADLTVRADGRRLATTENVALEPRLPADVGDIALLPGQTIAGVVLDKDGHALPDAEVSLSSMARLVVNRLEDLPRGQIGQEFGQRARTGPDGHFEISGLAGGHYTVHVRADGFERLSQEDVAAGTLDLRLLPVRLGGLFVEIVNDADGSPVPGARIKATGKPSDGPFGRFGGDEPLPVIAGAEALAAAGRQGDPAGAYFVRNAPREGTSLVVAADGFATLEAEGPGVESGAIGATAVRLVPESVVAGRVTRPDGTPIEAARITLAVKKADAEPDGVRFPGGRRFMRTMRVGDPDPNAELDAARLTSKTLPDGTFELRGVAPGDWELTAAHADCVDSSPLALALKAGESQRDLAITLQPAGAVIGLVTEADGTPAPDIEITLTPAAEAKAAGEPQTSDVTLQIGRMLGLDDGTNRRHARTEADGSYRVSGLAAGEYEVTLSSGARRGRRMGGGMVFAFAGDRGTSQHAQASWAKVVPGQDTRADFVRPRRGSITGRVIAGGRPVADVAVRLGNKPEPGAFAFPGFGGEEARSDDRGTFRFDEVEAGEYELTAHVAGSALERTVPVKLDAGAAASADLVFGGSTLSGRVVDKASGAGVPGVTLTVLPAKAAQDDEPLVQMSFNIVTVDDGGGSGGMSMEVGGGPAQLVRSGEDGKFELLYVEPGKYSLAASGGGYIRNEIGPVEVSDGENEDDLRIEVARGAIVRGSVISDQTGQKLDAVPVRIEGGETRQTTVTENGAFRFEGLEPGKYTVTVLGSGFGADFGMGGSALASEDIELELGQVRDLDLHTKS